MKDVLIAIVFVLVCSNCQFASKKDSGRERGNKIELLSDDLACDIDSLEEPRDKKWVYVDDSSSESHSILERRTICLKEKEFIESCDTLDLVLVEEWLGVVDSDYKNTRKAMPHNGFQGSFFRVLEENSSPPFGRQVLISDLDFNDLFRQYLVNFDDSGIILSGMLVHAENEYIVIPSPPYDDYGGKQISFIDTTYTDIDYKMMSSFSDSHLSIIKVYFYYKGDALIEEHFITNEYAIDNEGQFVRMPDLDRVIQLGADEVILEDSICNDVLKVVIFDDLLKN